MHRVVLLCGEDIFSYLEVVNFAQVRLKSGTSCLPFDRVYRNFLEVQEYELRQKICDGFLTSNNDFTICISGAKELALKCIEFFVDELETVQNCRFGVSTVSKDGIMRNLTVADSKEPFALNYWINTRPIVGEYKRCVGGLSNRDDVTLVNTFELMKSSCSESQFLRIIELPNMNHWNGNDMEQTTFFREFQVMFHGLRENVDLNLSNHPVPKLLRMRSQFRKHSYLSVNVIGGQSRASVLSHLLYCQSLIQPPHIDRQSIMHQSNEEMQSQKYESEFAITAIELEKERDKNKVLSTKLSQHRISVMNIQNQLDDCQYQKDIADAECEKLRSQCEKRQQQGELAGEQRAILRVDRNLMELTFENARLRQSVEVHQKAIHQFKEMCFKRETSIKKQQVEALTNAHELLKEIDELKAEMKTLKADNEAKNEILLKYKEFKKEAVDSDNQWREKNEYQKQLIDKLEETESVLKSTQEENLTLSKRLEVFSLSKEQQNDIYVARNKKLQESIDELNSELERLKQSNDEIANELKEEREKSLDYLRSHQKEIQEQRKKFDAELKEVQQKTNEINEAEKSCLLNLHKKEQSNLKSKLYQDHVKVENRLKYDTTLAENRLEARQKELEETMSELEASERKRIELLAEKTDLQISIDRLEQENSALKRSEDKASHQQQLLEAKETTIKNLYEQRETQLAKAEAERKKMQDEIFRVQNEKKLIQKESEDAKYAKFLEYRKLETKYNTNSSTLELLQKEHSELKKEKKETDGKLRELQKLKREEDRKYRLEIMDLKDRSGELQELVDNNDKKRKEDIAKLEKKLRYQYEDKITRIESDKEDLQDNVKRLKIIVEDEKTSRRERTKELLDLRDQKLKEKKGLIDKHHAEQVKFKQENESLQGKIDELGHKVDRLRLERDRLKKSNERIREELMNKDELMQITLQDCNDDAYDKLLKDSAAKEQQYAQDIQKLKGRVQRLLADKESLKASQEKLKADIQDSKLQSSVTSSEIKSLQNSEKKLRSDLSNAKSKFQRMQKRNETLEKEKEELERRVENSELAQSGQSELSGKLQKVRAQFKESRRKSEDQKGLIEQQRDKIKALEKEKKRIEAAGGAFGVSAERTR